jgi:16S rRNA (guanine527-N7)-methyltransferase
MMFHVKQEEGESALTDDPPLAAHSASAVRPPLDAQQESALREYAALLLDWNSKVNLVSRKDAENLWTTHILQSLSLLRYVQIPDGAAVLDLGTGGGLPGIPLAIAKPGIHVTLLDSIKKKTMVLTNVIAQLPLGNVSVVTQRAEDFAKTPDGRRRFDVVIARAVAPLAELIMWAKPLAAPKRFIVPITDGGTDEMLSTPLLIAMKGGDLVEEIRHARVRHPALIVKTIPLTVQEGESFGWEDKKILVIPL